MVKKEQEDNVNEVTLDRQSILNSIERIHYYISHYQNLLKYTNKTVKQKKKKNELKYWEQELINHENALKQLMKL